MKRWVTIAAAVWVLLNLLMFMYGEATGMVISGFTIGGDYRVYRDGAAALLDGSAVYDLTPGPMTTNLTYRYHPAFLLPFAVLIQLPYPAQVIVWWSAIAAAYVAGVLLWYRLLRQFGFDFWHLLPLFALIAYDWIGNLTYGNVGPALVLLSGGLLWAVINKRLALTGLLAAVILVIKPQWCFPLLYALALKEDRWFLRSIAAALVGYAGLSALFVVLAGFDRGVALLGDYYQFALTLQSRYPWKGTEVLFNTSQNSLYQTFLRYGAAQATAAIGTLLIQIALVLTLGALLLRVRKHVDARRAALVTLAGYVVGMCLLPQFEEGLLAGILAGALWTAYRPARIYLGYALLQFSGIVGVITGIHAFYLFSVLPVNLLMLLILFAGLARAILQPAPVDARPVASSVPMQRQTV